MLEFLINQNSSEAPSFMGILLVVLSSFFLSFLIVITYKITTPVDQQTNNFTQSLALISIIAATVMQAIGDSLARGLGMLGALAIIRFRTRLDDPRNMTFMFASIAVGISCGVFGFTVAFVGTIGFCLAALLVFYSGLSSDSLLSGNVKVSFPPELMNTPAIENILSLYCRSYTLDRFRTNTDTISPDSNEETESTEIIIHEVTYQFKVKRNKKPEQLLADLQNLDGLHDIRFRMNTPNNETV